MLILVLKCIVLALLGTFIFDCVHYILHVFEHSRFRLLRYLGSLHAIHHDFLDREMKLNRQHRFLNVIHHVIPEYTTAVIGMAVLSHFFFGWEAGAIVIAIRTVMVLFYIAQKGEDFTHAELKRVKAQRSLIWVGPNYHALHHVYVRQYYSSFVNIFDLIFGTNCQLKERRILVTGSQGAFGSAMIDALKRRGAIVESAVSGVDFQAGEYSGVLEKLTRAEILVLAHGAKGERAWEANYVTCVDLIDLFREIGKDRLVPPEVWGLGSEIEIHPSFGLEDLKAYCVSKRAFARRARFYYTAPDVTYRHIVPSAFRSGLGGGLMSASTAVNLSLFFIVRGFRYIPVTYTTLAFWNYFKFIFLRPEENPKAAPLPVLKDAR